MLNSAQKLNFQNDGYLVLPEYFNQVQCDMLKAEALKIVDDFDPSSSRSVFSTKARSDQNRDAYFLNSADKISCFFEEDAFAQDGKLNQDKQLSINKIGHALHELNSTFAEFSQSTKNAGIAEALGVRRPEIRQSMYIFKQPKIGGEIRWHQDASYFYTTPQSVLTFWFAIEDATIENGCLQIDKQGASFPLKEQFKRNIDDQTELLSLNNIEWPGIERALPLEVSAGTLIVFNGALPHFSEANRSRHSRHAFTLHLTSADATYSKFNWIQTPGTRIYA